MKPNRANKKGKNKFLIETTKPNTNVLKER